MNMNNFTFELMQNKITKREKQEPKSFKSFRPNKNSKRKKTKNPKINQSAGNFEKLQELINDT